MILISETLTNVVCREEDTAREGHCVWNGEADVLLQPQGSQENKALGFQGRAGSGDKGQRGAVTG